MDAVAYRQFTYSKPLIDDSEVAGYIAWGGLTVSVFIAATFFGGEKTNYRQGAISTFAVTALILALWTL